MECLLLLGKFSSAWPALIAILAVLAGTVAAIMPDALWHQRHHYRVVPPETQGCPPKGSSGNRANYDAALELLAEKVARKTGISKAAAYGEVLATEEGQQIYAGYCAATSTNPLPESYIDDEGAAIAKARPGPPVMVDSEAPGKVLSLIEKGERVNKSSLESALDALASKYQSSIGSFYKTYSMARDSELAGRSTKNWSSCEA